jgi:DNA-binding MarR family transcriptional regulator
VIGDLDPVIHAPKRLAAMAILANSSSTDFAFLRSYLELTESDLSKQMATLERAGYVKVTKSGRGRGATTTYQVTAAGKTAYERHVAALRAITSSVGHDEMQEGAGELEERPFFAPDVEEHR